MSYQALLFCPDEKTARVVSQVLSELEFTVEPCHEPFSAVKKLMVQHFDALVVDCDNEQNAALLFKSARNSGSNQASLAVAVVEGQTGVAKAFRLGANLVLTKPIHVEQSKGTLRVARGLLRKGQAAKAAAAAPGAAAPTMFAQQSVAAPLPPPQQKSAAPPSASAAAFELDAEPMPAPDAADAALLEYMPDSPVSSAENSTQAAAESDPSKQYPWQPRKPLAEPMASALRRAAEAAGKSEFDAAAPRPTAASQTMTPQAAVPQTTILQSGTAPAGFAQTRSGAAAAPARAKEIPAPDAKKLGLEPTASAIAAPSTEETETEIKRIEDPSASDGWDSRSPSTPTETPGFTSLDHEAQASGAGGSKKTGLIAVLVLGLAAAGYFGWTKMQSAPSQPAVPQSPISAGAGTAALPSQPTASAPETQPATGEVVAPQSEQGLSGTTVVPSSSKPSAAVIVEAPGAKPPAKATSAIDEVTVVKAPEIDKAEASPVLMVHNGSSTQPKPEPEAQEPEQAPAATSIATGDSTSALSGIVNTNAMNAQKAPQETLRISQGVSQGLVVKRVQPLYPPQARQIRLEGKVELQANISKSGSISSVKQLSGDPVLGRAAMDAVRQWKYKPYFLNGEPVEVETQVTVNFKLP
jgi:periplasmic protein TonB